MSASYNTLLYGMWAMVAGAGIPVMASINGALSKSLGNAPVLAAFILFLIALLSTGVLAFATGSFKSLNQLTDIPVYLFLGGVFVAIYVASVTTLVPLFGVANTILFVMLAQIITSSTIDHFGLLGIVSKPISFWRIVGVLIMVSGLALTQVADRISNRDHSIIEKAAD